MSAPASGAKMPVRWTGEGERFALRCGMCGRWWDLTTEFWLVRHGLQRCRDCWRAYSRLRQRAYTADELVREVRRYKARIAYRERAGEHNALTRAWKAANPERVAEYRRAYYAANRERLCAAERARKAAARAAA